MEWAKGQDCDDGEKCVWGWWEWGWERDPDTQRRKDKGD